MTIAEMTAADIEAVAALEEETFSTPWSLQGFADIVCREDVLFFVAREETLLGYAGAYCTADEGEITNVAVASGARRRGVGGALMEALIAQLAGRQIYRIVLEVRVSNEPAVRLYGKYGFRIAGKRKNFYSKPPEDAYVMVREPAVPYGENNTSSLQ